MVGSPPNFENFFMTEQLPYSERLRLIKLGLLPKEAVAKPKKAIKRVSDKKAAALAAEKEGRNGEETDLQKWYRKCVKQFTGYCLETGLRTETRIFEYALMSVAHILPKSTCPSVATHPLNWIELNVDFHKKFDAMSWEEREKLGCWPVIRERLIHVWLHLAEAERRHFPHSLRQWIENNEPFK